MDRADFVVIGAGVIGLAVARAAARRGREVLVLEAADGIGTETSSRNSEVIHAGIYYAAGSAKARHCVAGRRLLYRYCEEASIPHARCGKLIVATTADEATRLAAIRERARANGVDGPDELRLLTPAEVATLEPEVACTAALFSPSTGIVDSHALMLALQADAEAHGATFAFQTRVGRIRAGAPHEITVGQGDGGEWILGANTLVVAAGLRSAALFDVMTGVNRAARPDLYYLKGNYFSLQGKTPFRHLVYPLPVPGGLGVHATIDLAGRTRFGPDTEPIDGIDYAVDSSRAASFYGSIRRYWPALPDAALAPDYCGIRPKLRAPAGEDFLIQGPEALGADNLVFLHGIESPGLTASLSLADAVCDLTRLARAAA